MVKKPNHFLYRSKLRTMNVRATYVPRMPKEAMLTKLRKKDFLRTDSPALKMMGGRKNLQQHNAFSLLLSESVDCTQQNTQQLTVNQHRRLSCSLCTMHHWCQLSVRHIANASVLQHSGESDAAVIVSYVKKFPGLKVSIACSDSDPRYSVAASRPSPIARPSPQAVMPSPTKLNLDT